MNRNQKIQEGIKIIGDYGRFKQPNQDRIKSIRITPSQTTKNNRSKFSSASNFLKIYSQDAFISVIDKNQEAWLIGQPFNSPVNISDLIHKKITKVFLGEKQMIVRTKDGFILINWGSMMTMNENLMKINIFNSGQDDSLFKAYLITSVEDGDFLYYSIDKKIQNSNRLFEIRNCAQQIIGHPTLNSIKIPSKVVKGVSVGKYHSLYWDSEGCLYSWGCRSLALGYEYFPDNSSQIPQRVKMNKFVLMAFAATHYSLALTSQGNIYQWGIKMEFNQINQQPIFKPRSLDFRFFQCNAKFVTLRGRDNNFAALSSTGELYVWGLTAKPMLAPNIYLPPSWQGLYIYQPVLQTDFQGLNIVDFTIEMTYISVIVGRQGCDGGEGEYWKVLKERAKNQLFQYKNNRVKTEHIDNINNLRKKYKNSMLSDNYTPQSALYTPRPQQQKPHLQLQLEPISKKPHKQKTESLINININPKIVKNTPSLLSNTISLSTLNSSHRRQISDCFRYNTSTQNEHSDIRCSLMNTTFRYRDSKKEGLHLDKKFSATYKMRLQGVLQKKRKLQTISLTTNLKKIDQRQVEHKKKRKQQEQARQTRQEQKADIESTLIPFLTKIYIAKILSSCLDYARLIKRGTIKRMKMIHTVEKSINNLFVGVKIKSVNEQQKEISQRFALLAIYFKNYVIKFRERKRNTLKKVIVRQIITDMVRQKLRTGVLKTKRKIKRINRLGEWINIYNKERVKILKQLWNNFILATFKTSDGGRIIHNNVNIDATFYEKYNIAVQSKYIQPLNDYYHSIKKSKQEGDKRSLNEIRKRGNFRYEQFKEKLSQMDILPYSLHFNYFKRPKNWQITISEGVKSDPGWIGIERKVQLDIFRNIFKKSDEQYLQKRRQYQIDLANFIKINYQTFYEMRWKYILQYNKMEKTLQKRKKQKQLRRLLGLIGMQKLVDEDCIPEKNMVLEEAFQRRDVPKAPIPLLDFDLTQFELNFKNYWENIYAKAKLIRKKNL